MCRNRRAGSFTLVTHFNCAFHITWQPDANKAILDKAATLLKSVKVAKLTVSGYTDSTGNANSNKALSQRRAQSVVDYLVSQGVDAAQLNAVGNGADNPVADNATDEGRFKNRRIEFSVNP